ESGFQEDADALDGLVSLGYSLREARDAIKHIPKEAKTVEEKVKASLKILGKK
ncbi:Holliday junction branch migration protein RuvA, partial [Patescibacteria group bacterium]|nr:Holliday junction branch migration protein RuvA [Patescibacteria group bacterium]